MRDTAAPGRGLGSWSSLPTKAVIALERPGPRVYAAGGPATKSCRLPPADLEVDPSYQASERLSAQPCCGQRAPHSPRPSQGGQTGRHGASSWSHGPSLPLTVAVSIFKYKANSSNSRIFNNWTGNSVKPGVERCARTPSFWLMRCWRGGRLGPGAHGEGHLLGVKIPPQEEETSQSVWNDPLLSMHSVTGTSVRFSGSPSPSACVIVPLFWD